MSEVFELKHYISWEKKKTGFERVIKNFGKQNMNNKGATRENLGKIFQKSYKIFHLYVYRWYMLLKDFNQVELKLVFICLKIGNLI